MPDGYGDGMDLALLNLAHTSAGPQDHPHFNQAMTAVARLCHVLGIGKKDTLSVLGLTHSNENYWWLQHAWGESNE